MSLISRLELITLSIVPIIIFQSCTSNSMIVSSPTQSTQPTSTSSLAPVKPSAQPTLEPVPIVAIKPKIEATNITASTQYPTDSYSYFPKNIADADPKTAWIPGKTDSNNTGQWIKFEFPNKVTLNKFSIINGWTISDDLWKRNSRFKNITLSFSDNIERSFKLSDIKDKQTFDLNGVLTSFVQITIVDSYSGTEYTEAGISEVEFY